MKHRTAAILSLCLLCTPGGLWAQVSVTSLAAYKRKQDDQLAQSIKDSQTRARTGRLAMMAPANGRGVRASRPAVIKLAHPPRQTGVDNRRGTVAR